MLDIPINREKIQEWSISLDENSSFRGELKVLGINGTEETDLGYIKSNSYEDFIIENAGNFKSIKLKGEEGFALAPGASIILKVQSEFRNKNKNIVPNNSSSYFYKNRIESDVTYSSNKVMKAHAKAQIRINKVNPELEFNSKVSSAKENYTPYENIKHVSVLSGKHVFESYGSIDLTKAVFLLPEGMKYKEGTGTLNILHFLSSSNDSRIIEPQVIENFNSTKKTALIFDLGKVEYLDTNKILSVTEYVTITFESYFTELAEKGEHNIESLLVWDKLEDVKIKTEEVLDTYDLTEDTNSKLLYSNLKLNFMPAKQLVLRKEVKGSLDNDYVLFPNSASTEFGDEIQYRLTLINNSVDDIDNVHVLDLLPEEGDLTVSRDIALDAQRRERHSTLAVTLVGAVLAPEGYDVFYNTESPSADVENYYRSSQWVSELEDYSTAKAIKIVLKDGFILKSEDRVSFDMTVKLPKEMNENDINKAVNSYGASTSDSLVFFESNFATVDVHTYTIDGYVFIDDNRDGMFDLLKETKKANYRIELVDENDKPIVDDLKNNIVAKTNSDGYFKFKLPKSGTYKIKVTIPEGYEATQYIDHIEGSTISETGLSHSITLNKTNKHVRLNAGFRTRIGDLEISKSLLSKKGESFENNIDFNFTLKLDNDLYNGDVTVEDQNSEISVKTITDGNISLKANEKSIIADIDKGTTYSIVEIPTEGYKAKQSKFDGVIDKKLNEVEFVNVVEDVKTDFTLTKEWIDGPSDHPTIKVQLFRDDDAFGDAIELVDGVTTYTWTDLDLTDDFGDEYVYTVDEVNVPENYKKDVVDNKITNTYVIPKFDYTVIKEWIDGPSDHPTIEVQLFRDDVAFGDAIELVDGVTTYTWTDLDLTDEFGIEYVYTVDEVNVPENYTKEVVDNVITNTYIEEEEIRLPKDPDTSSKDDPEVAPNTPDAKEDSKTPTTGIDSNSVLYLNVILLLSLLVIYLKESTKQKKIN